MKTDRRYRYTRRTRENPPRGQARIGDRPIAVFMAGLPASGKSSYVAKMRFDDEGFTVIDVDRFKLGHPGYDPKNPSTVHEWSKRQADRFLECTLGAQEPFVYDGTGVNVEWMVKLIRRAQSAGYTTFVVHVDVPLALAKERNRKRARTVPEWILDEKASAIDEAMRILRDYADYFERIDGMSYEAVDQSIEEIDRRWHRSGPKGPRTAAPAGARANRRSR